MDAVKAWAATTEVSEDDLAELMVSLNNHGVTSMEVVVAMRPEDWHAIAGKIGHSVRLAAAVRNIASNNAIAEMKSECSELRNSLNDMHCCADKLQSKLEELKRAEARLDTSITSQVNMLRSEMVDLSLQKLQELELDISVARNTNENIKNEIAHARDATARAVAEKEALISQAINTQVNRDRTDSVTAISLPSLDSLSISKKEGKFTQDRWANIKKAPWFAGDADRDACVERLLQPGVSTGCFVVRSGPNENNPYQLSFRGVGEGQTSVRHVRVLKDALTGLFFISKQKMDSFQAKSIQDLVSYYMNVNIVEGISLTDPPPRLRPKSKAIRPEDLPNNLNS